jgi:bifunctional non-homologous end joining protein LigD
MANLGCIEMNPWHSRTSSWQRPDWCLVDLDPDTSNSFEQVMEVAKMVKQVLDSMPAITSVERKPAKRKGMIYLDYLQNRETQTAAAPYSLRPKPGVPVSTPLDWSELKKGLTPQTWNA